MSGISGEKLRSRAKLYGIPVEDMRDEEVSEALFEEVKNRDTLEAFEFKFREKPDSWGASQWKEVAEFLGYEEAMRYPAFLRGYSVIVEDFVSRLTPGLLGNYDHSFIKALVGLAEGNPHRIRKGIERLAEYHSGQSFRGVRYNGDVISFLYDRGVIEF